MGAGMDQPGDRRIIRSQLKEASARARPQRPPASPVDHDDNRILAETEAREAELRRLAGDDHGPMRAFPRRSNRNPPGFTGVPMKKAQGQAKRRSRSGKVHSTRAR